jgi:coenzyme F420-0:L-glutamate ligase/coenzyme F420-1:gamma-L-glutamate ligase
MKKVEVFGLDTLPLVKKGDDIPGLIITAVGGSGLEIEDGDIIVVTEKIVSKAQGRLLPLESVVPSRKAQDLARVTGKDPRLVELILGESREVVRAGEGHLIVETRDGHILANAGIDQSNIPGGFVKLPPLDPDGVAEEIRGEIMRRTGKRVGVVISDSVGRPFRSGSIGVAIGSSGLASLYDRRGEKDLYGRELEVTQVGVADCIASTANLVGGEAAEGIPVVLIRGLDFPGEGRAADLVRPREQDLFR